MKHAVRRTHLAHTKVPQEWQTGIPTFISTTNCKADLNLKTFKRISGQKLTTDSKQTRLQRCQKLLQRFPSDRSVRKVWFSNVKLFTVANPANTQNDRIYSSTVKTQISASRLVRECEHFSRSMMVSVAVSKVRKTNVVFVDTGTKVDSDY